MGITVKNRDCTKCEGRKASQSPRSRPTAFLLSGIFANPCGPTGKLRLLGRHTRRDVAFDERIEVRAPFLVHFSLVPFPAKQPGEPDKHGADGFHVWRLFRAQRDHRIDSCRATKRSHDRMNFDGRGITTREPAVASYLGGIPFLIGFRG
jgi:hypothetical protein